MKPIDRGADRSGMISTRRRGNGWRMVDRKAALARTRLPRGRRQKAARRTAGADRFAHRVARYRGAVRVEFQPWQIAALALPFEAADHPAGRTIGHQKRTCPAEPAADKDHQNAQGTSCSLLSLALRKMIHWRCPAWRLPGQNRNIEIPK